ncbi:hypothetical protein BB561_000534 [Smittium simulii]|uniref:General negative regulator of transcription subunit n=1 Tax=Smittium simulii TaxID=133385 RepID=A0A2T9YYL1_9FUNG|nr:hypothetical protein BB561_000534 [Smittium simulii]
MSRKLQAEIDRVLKKVTEGIEDFENFYKKIQVATTTSLKDKHEADLKKEIKKLQRLRDQIKSWIQSSEVKEKSELIHHRKLIEKQMERFKAIEKEMKTKAYSKEGLSQSTKLDPREKQKQEIVNWLTEMIDKLSTQIDVYEVEAEQLSSSVSKKKKDASKVKRIKAIDVRVEHHKEHINSLERIQRLLENESLSVEQILNIQEDVNYYVDENDNDDFAEDESIYDDLDLDNEELFNVSNDLDDSSDESHDSDSNPIDIPAQTTTSFSIVEKEPINPTVEVRPSVNLKMTMSPLKQRNVWRDGKESAINLSKTREVPTPSPVVSTPKISLVSNIIPAPVKPQALAHPWAAIASQGKNVSAGTKRATSTVNSVSTEKNTLSTTEKIPISIQKSNTDKKIEVSTVSIANNTNTIKTNNTTCDFSNTKVDNEFTKTAASTPQKKQKSKQKPIDSSTDQQENIESTESFGQTLFDREDLPESLSKLRTFYSRTKVNYIPLSKDSVYRKNMMSLSLNSIPTLMDQENAKQFTPQNPVSTPSYYPQTTLPSFSQPTALLNLSLESLFFIFYYQKNTYYQYLAIKQLKEQSWRFHKRYLTWFRRFDEPSQITDEYEKGTYLYFDYEGSWSQKKKTEFVFEYQYLD